MGLQDLTPPFSRKGGGGLGNMKLTILNVKFIDTTSCF